MKLGIRHVAKPRPRASIAIVLAMGLDYPLDWDDENLRILEVGVKEDASTLLHEENISVLILGPDLSAESAQEVLAQRQAEYPGACTSNIVLGCGANVTLFQPFLDEDQLFYVSRGAMPLAQLQPLVLAGAQRFHFKQKELEDGLQATAAPATRVLDFCTRLAFQTDLATAGELLVEAVQILVSADRAHYLIYEEEEETLWTARVGADSKERSESPCAGLVGYVARTGEPVRLERCVEDSRYDVETDDPGGAQDSRFLTEPMLGNDGTVIAVVTAVRNGTSEPFSDDEVATLKLLTACSASTFGGILLQKRIRALLLEQVESTFNRANVFRQEAIEYYAGEQKQEGEILYSSPAWLRHTHWLSIGLLLLGFLWMALARVHQKASGQAVVKALRKITATASTAGVIRSVVVAQGDHVRAGDLLVQFYAATGSTTMERVNQEVRAPSDGVVSDIRVHAGQAISAGDQIASVVDDASGYELISFFPGYYAPQLHPGMKVVLKVNGYPESHEILAMNHVGAEVIGPREAQQYAGRESSDAALQVTGPVVSVRAALTARSFEAGEDSYRYYDGMTGEAEVVVHSEPLLVHLIPGLKGIFSKVSP